MLVSFSCGTSLMSRVASTAWRCTETLQAILEEVSDASCYSTQHEPFCFKPLSPLVLGKMNSSGSFIDSKLACHVVLIRLSQ